MFYLDPRNIDAKSCRRWVPRTLPSEVRDFGFYPDIDLLKPGDLILVRNLVCVQEPGRSTKQSILNRSSPSEHRYCDR